MKCKWCNQEISKLGIRWYDQGLILRDLCTLSPVFLHLPEDIEVSEEKTDLPSNLIIHSENETK